MRTWPDTSSNSTAGERTLTFSLSLHPNKSPKITQTNGLIVFLNWIIFFILERCLLLIHKRITIPTTNAIKDVANKGHISPEVMGILAQNIT